MHANVFIPDDYLQHINKQLPQHLALSDFVASCQKPLRRSIRVNTLKISLDDFKERANEKGWQLTPIPWCETGFWITEDQSENLLGNSAEHLAGLFYIQEASSMLPVSALFSSITDKNISVLDMAAAPGSKTTQIAALLDHQGLVVANEYSASRVKILHANQVRLGVTHCALTHFDAKVFGTWLPEYFDAILLDAPCSGEGTVRKDAKAFSNWSIAAMQEIAETQKSLLISAFQALKPNGVMVYSTCTLSQEENQQVCQFLKETYPDEVEFEPLDELFSSAKQATTAEGFLHIFPQIFDTEGFFVAKIRKKASVKIAAIEKKPRNFPFSKLAKKEQQHLKQGLADSFGLSIPENLMLWAREQEIWLFPALIEPLLSEVKFERIGLKLAQKHKHGFRWQHEAVLALCAKQQPKKVELTAAEATQWYKGQDIHPSTSAKGETLVYYRGHPIGMGKWIGNKIKNGLPRERVRDEHLFVS